jgi:hypothetical protein
VKRVRAPVQGLKEVLEEAAGKIMAKRVAAAASSRMMSVRLRQQLEKNQELREKERSILSDSGRGNVLADRLGPLCLSPL